MANERGQTAIRHIDTLRQQLDPILGTLEGYRYGGNQNVLLVPPVFCYEIPLALGDIDRYLGRIVQWIEHRPAPLQQTFSAPEAATVIRIVEKSQSALQLLHNCIRELTDPNSHGRLAHIGLEIRNQLRVNEVELKNFNDELDRNVRAAQAAAAHPSQHASNQRNDPTTELLLWLRSLVYNNQAQQQIPVANSSTTPPQPVDSSKLRDEYNRGSQHGETKGYEKGLTEGLSRGHDNGLDEACRRLVALGGFSSKTEPTPLMRAVLHGSQDDVRFLHRIGVDFNEFSITTDPSQKDARRRSPLCAAIERNDSTLVLQLLELGALIDLEEPDGGNALLAAAVTGNEKIIFLLFERGAQALLDSQYRIGELKALDPICVAVQHSHTPAAKLLFEKRRLARLALTTHTLPLRIAARKGNYTLVDHFLKEDVDLNNQDNVKQKTPLFSAISTGQSHVIRLLSLKGANSELFDVHQRTPLLHAMSGDSELDDEGRREIISVLIENGAELEHHGGRYSALICAVVKSNMRFVELLIEQGADINYIPHRETGMKPALYEALSRGSHEIAKVLFRAGASLSNTNELCECVFEKAITKGDLSILKLLLSQRNLKNYIEDWSQERVGPLHLAISHGQARLIPYLVECGANVEFASSQGDEGNYRPLHHAAKMMDFEAVTRLLHLGANPKQKTTTGVCVKCKARPNDKPGLYPRCFLENQRFQAHQNIDTKIAWDQVNAYIKKYGGTQPPNHSKVTKRK